MSPLEQLHADQHDDITLPCDHALQAFLAETSLDVARLDLYPTTAVESLHLNRTRSTAA
jgi:hypothetical protein